MSDLVVWLTAQLDADEATARAAIERSKVYTGPAPLRWMWSVTDGESSGLQATRHDPARVLAEVNAKRAILDIHPGSDDCGVWHGDCPTVRALARPFAGRPGWREEWGTQ